MYTYTCTHTILNVEVNIRNILQALLSFPRGGRVIIIIIISFIYHYYYYYYCYYTYGYYYYYYYYHYYYYYAGMKGGAATKRAFKLSFLFVDTCCYLCLLSTFKYDSAIFCKLSRLSWEAGARV